MKRSTEWVSLLLVLIVSHAAPAQPAPNPLMEVPPVVSSWDDLTEGLSTKEDWEARRPAIKQQFLDLLRDQYKPEKPPLDLQVHETVEVDGVYTRKLISYAVEAGERAHAYLGIPLKTEGKLPAVVVLHQTYDNGAREAAGLEGDPDYAQLDHLSRRGYITIAPDHFVAGHRIPQPEAYDTTAFHAKHPEWTAAGKFTYEHSIAIDVLETLPEVDTARIGVIGHSLGGQGAIFLTAYDDRIKAAVSNCPAPTFRHNPKVLSWSRDHWYTYFKHIRPGLLNNELPPIDFHHMAALAAPRPFLHIAGLNDGEAGTQRQRVLMMLSVSTIYGLVGAPENHAFYFHGHGHGAPFDARELMYGWLDMHLKPATATEARLLENTGP